MILAFAFLVMLVVAGAGLIFAGARSGMGRGATASVAAAVLLAALLTYTLVGAPFAPTAAAPSVSTLASSDQARQLALAAGRRGDYSRAAQAWGRAETLAPTVAEFPSSLGEALTQVAGGKVTPEAAAAFRRAAALDAADPRARFYLALADFQAGRRDLARSEWAALIASAPPGAPWLADVRATVARAEARPG